jgi:enoyl-CoA hydratase/carnithine racemase
MTEPVVVTSADGIAEVLLNRPHKRNAVDDAIYIGLLKAAARLREDVTVRAIVLAGAGESFCAGADTSTFDRMREHGRSAKWRPADADETAAAVVDVDGLQLGRGQRTALVWRTMPVPVIAAVRGAAVGLGLQLALGADIRIAAPDATLGAFEIRWGLAPDSGGTQLLPALIGADRALELCATGRAVTGAQALAYGLVTSLADDPYRAAHDLARSIAARNPDAVRSIVRLIRMATPRLSQEGLIAERTEMVANIGSPNQRAAVAAARDGRPAIFADPTAAERADYS